MNPLSTVAYYTFIDNVKWMNIEQLLNLFSIKEQEKIYSLKRDKDKIASSVGKLLLNYMLNKFDYQSYMEFPVIEYTDEGRPYLKGKNFDFNISHAHNIVACAICFRGTIGIDVEKIRKLNIAEYTSVLTEEEYFYLKNNVDKKQEFIKLWTIKEAALKADGRGFLANIEDLSVMNNISTLKNQIWHNYTYKIKGEYYLTIAANHSVRPIISEIDVTKLINK